MISVRHCNSVDTREILKKMKILNLNQQISALIGICSLPEESDLYLRILQIICTFSVFASLFPYVGLCALYAVEHFRLGDIENALFALFTAIGVFSTFASLISLFLRRSSVRHFFDKIQNIFDECKFCRKLEKTF